MNIDNLTYGELKQIATLFNNTEKSTSLSKDFIGKKVIVRTYSAGVHFGTVEKADGNEVILKDSRRLWYWKAKKGITLSAVAINGINTKESKIATKVDRLWLQQIELLEMTDEAIKTIEESEEHEAR